MINFFKANNALAKLFIHLGKVKALNFDYKDTLYNYKLVSLGPLDLHRPAQGSKSKLEKLYSKVDQLIKSSPYYNPNKIPENQLTDKSLKKEFSDRCLIHNELQKTILSDIEELKIKLVK